MGEIVLDGGHLWAAKTHRFHQNTCGRHFRFRKVKCTRTYSYVKVCSIIKRRIPLVHIYDQSCLLIKPVYQIWKRLNAINTVVTSNSMAPFLLSAFWINRGIILPHLKIIFAKNSQSKAMANNEGVIQALHGEFMRVYPGLRGFYWSDLTAVSFLFLQSSKTWQMRIKYLRKN